MSNSYKHLTEINVKKLLKNNVNKDLYFKVNYKKLTTDDCDSIVWQQMSCENFCKFLKNKALYFKQLSKFNDGDERGLKFYKNCYIGTDENNPKRNLMEKLYKDFEKIVYISCWFDLPWLTKLVFEKYAGEEAGIAIGVKKEKLLSTIDTKAETNNGIASYEEIFYGNTAYIQDEHRDVVNSDEAIAPLFLKSTYHSSDNEFRLVYIKDSLWKCDYYGLKLSDEELGQTYINIGEPKDFIDYIAVRDCQETFDCICKAFNLKTEKADNTKMDGFTVYKIND